MGFYPPKYLLGQSEQSVPGRLSVTVPDCPVTQCPDLFGALFDSVPVIEEMAHAGTEPVIQGIADDQVLFLNVHADGTQGVTGKFDHSGVKAVSVQIFSLTDEDQVIRPLYGGVFSTFRDMPRTARPTRPEEFKGCLSKLSKSSSSFGWMATGTPYLLDSSAAFSA